MDDDGLKDGLVSEHIYTHLRNRKHFLFFHEVLQNNKRPLHARTRRATFLLQYKTVVHIIFILY